MKMLVVFSVFLVCSSVLATPAIDNTDNTVIFFEQKNFSLVKNIRTCDKRYLRITKIHVSYIQNTYYKNIYVLCFLPFPSRAEIFFHFKKNKI